MEHLKSSLVYAAIIAWVCTIVDGYATFFWVKNGYGAEANPLIAQLMLWTGIGWAMLIRVIIGLALLIWLLHFAKKGYNIAKYGMYGVTVVLFFVVGWHSYGVWLLLSH